MEGRHLTIPRYMEVEAILEEEEEVVNYARSSVLSFFQKIIHDGSCKGLLNRLKRDKREHQEWQGFAFIMYNRSVFLITNKTFCVCGVREGSTDASMKSREAAFLQTLYYITDQ